VDEDDIHYVDFSSEAGHDLAFQLMTKPNPPTAILCGDDMMAFGVIQGLQEAGRRVPQDVSVIGFDDISLARFSTPPLTTIRQDTFRKGQIAAETLIRLMTKGIENSPFQQILSTQLIIRNTTALAPR
jgi:DNA-binding LacI/PurR family transcriptional regulator